MTSTVTIHASEHPIKSVKLFNSSKAEVVRTFKLDLQEGQNKVLIRGLPTTLEPNSVRVSGLSASARLCDVVATNKYSSPETHAPNSPQKVVRTLEAKLHVLESEKATKDLESHVLLKYAQTLTGEHVEYPERMEELLDEYLEREHKRLEASLKLKEDIRQLQRQIAEETEKTTLKRGTARGRVDVVIVSDIGRTVELKLTYIVSNATWTPTYELHATTENGKPSSSVSLHYRVGVSQSTGEDWNDAALTLTSDTVARQIPPLRMLKFTTRPTSVRQGQAKNGLFGSTANTTFSAFGQSQPTEGFGSTLAFGATTSQTGGPGLFGAAPASNTFGTPFGSKAQSVFGSTSTSTQQPTPAFGTKTQAPSSFGKFGGFGSSTSTGGAFGVSSTEPPPASTDGSAANKNSEADKGSTLQDTKDSENPSFFTDPTTIVFETPIANSFTVPGKLTIPSDGDSHQVTVAVLPFTAKISYVVSPRIDPRVFLQCKVKNTSEYQLPAGPVTVILDDSNVSITSISDVNVNDTFTCTLGSDASVKVKYSRSSKTLKSFAVAFSEVTNTTTYTTTISIHNKHQFPISNLIVRDVIPTCEDKRVNVVLKKPVGLADAKGTEWVAIGKEGLKVGWKRVVDGKGGQKEGTFEWRWKIGNGAQIKLEAEWEVNAPGDITWVESI